MSFFIHTDLNFPLLNMIDTFSQFSSYNSDEDFELNLSKNIYTIKISFIILIAIIFILLLLYISTRFALTVDISKGIRYPKPIMRSILILSAQIIYWTYYIYKYNINTINDMITNIKNRLNNITFEKNTISENKSNNNLNNNTWKSIADNCNADFQEVFKNIIGNFENYEININYDNPLSHLNDINEEDIQKIQNEINNQYNIDLSNWSKNNNEISNIFSKKFKEFNDIQINLLEIKSKIKELTDWSKSTESLFKNLENSDNNLKENIEKYIKTKMESMNFTNLIETYKNLFLELKVLLNYLNYSPDIQLISKCPICITNFKDSLIVPCGHTACIDCLNTQKNIDNKIICPICRSEGTKISKIYY